MPFGKQCDNARKVSYLCWYMKLGVKKAKIKSAIWREC